MLFEQFYNSFTQVADAMSLRYVLGGIEPPPKPCKSPVLPLYEQGIILDFGKTQINLVESFMLLLASVLPYLPPNTGEKCSHFYKKAKTFSRFSLPYSYIIHQKSELSRVQKFLVSKKIK